MTLVWEPPPLHEQMATLTLPAGVPLVAEDCEDLHNAFKGPVGVLLSPFYFAAADTIR